MRNGQEMRIFKTRWFAVFARKEGVSDAVLVKEAGKIERGETGTALGGYVYKLRIARPGEGKSGGYRVILFFRHKNRLVFDYAYSKSQKDNISEKELRILKGIAKDFMNSTNEHISFRLKKMELEEIKT